MALSWFKNLNLMRPFCSLRDKKYISLHNFSKMLSLFSEFTWVWSSVHFISLLDLAHFFQFDMPDPGDVKLGESKVKKDPDILIDNRLTACSAKSSV